MSLSWHLKTSTAVSGCLRSREVFMGIFLATCELQELSGRQGVDPWPHHDVLEASGCTPCPLQSMPTFDHFAGVFNAIQAL